MHEDSHCVDADATMRTGPLQCSCVASLILCEWVCSKKRTRVDSSSRPLTLGPVASYSVYAKQQRHFAASSSGPETLEGHHETKRPQAHGSYPACNAWFEGQNHFPGTFWKEWKLRGWRLFHCKSKKSKSDVRSNSVTQEMISQKGNAGFQLYCVHVKIAYLLWSLVYFSAAFFPPLGWKRKSFWFLCCIIFLYFRQKYYFINSDSWYPPHFQFPLYQTQPLLCAQPSMSWNIPFRNNR